MSSHAYTENHSLSSPPSGCSPRSAGRRCRQSMRRSVPAAHLAARRGAKWIGWRRGLARVSQWCWWRPEGILGGRTPSRPVARWIWVLCLLPSGCYRPALHQVQPPVANQRNIGGYDPMTTLAERLVPGDTSVVVDNLEPVSLAPEDTSPDRVASICPPRFPAGLRHRHPECQQHPHGWGAMDECSGVRKYR